MSHQAGAGAPSALVSISVSPIGATRAPRRGTRPRVALTLSSAADCKRETAVRCASPGRLLAWKPGSDESRSVMIAIG
jgi:hypothetical protein